MPRWNSYLLPWAACMPDWSHWRTRGGYAKNGVPFPLRMRLGYAKKWPTPLKGTPNGIL